MSVVSPSFQTVFIATGLPSDGEKEFMTGLYIHILPDIPENPDVFLYKAENCVGVHLI